MLRRNLIPIWLGIILLSGMFLMGQEAECPWSEAVHFVDSSLEQAVRGAIGKPSGDICSSDLDGLTVLDTGGLGIQLLNGLQHCSELVELDLSWNMLIKNLQPLSGLNNLTRLDLYYNVIEDVQPLAGLTHLTELSLGFNLINDIQPLANLTELTELHINDNYITSIQSLANLVNLNYLTLHFNEISDIYPLVENSGMGVGDYVDLGENPLSSTSCNVYVPELESRGVSVLHDCP